MASKETRLVEIVVNGEARNVPEASTVLELLADLALEPEHVALELDREILKRDRWSGTRLGGGERLEIVHFVGGG